MGGPAESPHSSELAIQALQDCEQQERRRLLGVVFPLKAKNLTNLQAGGQMIDSPLFGAFLDRTIRANQNYQASGKAGEFQKTLDRMAFFGNYVVAAALAGGEFATAKILFENEQAMIPAYGRITLPGADKLTSAQTTEDGSILLRSPNSKVSAQIFPDELNGTTAEAWESLRRFEVAGMTITVDDINPNRDIFRYPSADRLTDEAYERFSSTIGNALTFMQAYAPRPFGLVRATLTTIVPALPEPFPFSKCMSAGAAPGVLGLSQQEQSSDPDPERLASQIVFGTGKALLMAMRAKHTEDDRHPDIHRPETDRLSKKPVYPPSQEGFATPMHLFEGVLLGTLPLEYFENLTNSIDDRISRYGQLSLTRWYTEVQQNMLALEASGYIFDGNREIVAAVAKHLTKFKASFDSMPQWMKQVVAASRHDHRTSWRLQMITPDHQTIERLCDAWRAQQPCPPITIPGELSRKIDAPHVGQRTRYVLAETWAKDPHIFNALRADNYNPAPFGNPTKGDVALVLQDTHAARDYFSKDIQTKPESNEAWAGFALTFLHKTSLAAQVLLRQPEVVKAFWNTLADPTITPEEVAAWLAPTSMAKLFQDSWPA